MKKALIILFNLILYIIVLQYLYAAFYNGASTIDVMVLSEQCAAQLNSWGIQNFSPLTVKVNFAVLTMAYFIVGIILGVSILGQAFFKEREKLKAYKRELEKTSIAGDNSSSKVSVLEAKIKVLEKALQDALNK